MNPNGPASARPKPPLWLATAALVFVWVAWGSGYMFNAVAIRSFSTPALVLLRCLLGLLVIGACLVWQKRGRIRFSRRQSFWLLVTGMMMFLGGNGLLIAVQRWTPSGVVAAMAAALPLWFAFFETIVTRVPPRRTVLVGLIVGMAGVSYLSLQRSEPVIAPIGASLALLSGALWAGGSLLSNAKLSGLPILSRVLGQLAGGGIAAFLLWLFMAAQGGFVPSDYSAASVGAVLYLGLVCTGAAFLAYQWLLSDVSSTVAATYAFVAPVIAVIFGRMFLDEEVGATLVVSMALVLCGVGLVLHGSRSRTLVPPADA